MSDARAQTETPFWRFSLNFYRQGGVANACIALQDEYGVDVNLLLFLLWLANNGQLLSGDEVKKLDESVRDWRKLTIVPIRDIRRKLKGTRTLIDPAEQETYRTKIKAIELEAERLQQHALYVFSQATRLGKQVNRTAAAHGNICAYEHIMNATFPKSAMEILLGALNSMTNGERSAASA